MILNRDKIKNKVDTFFFNNNLSEGEFITFLRITTGVFLIIQLSFVVFDFQLLYGKYGVIPYDIQDFIAPQKALTFSNLVTFFEQFQIEEYVTIRIFLIMFYSCSISLIIGLFSRFSSLILLFLYIAISSGPYKYGVDVFVTMGLFYLTVFPLCLKYSVDKFIFKCRRLPNYTPYLRLLQINLCLVYFFGGISKSIGSTWYNGEAIWKSLNLIGTLPLDYSILASNKFILVFMGWSVIILEIFYVIAIWREKIGLYWFISILLMHLGISIFLGLYFFGIYMIILNISGFYFSNIKAKLL